MQNGPFTSYKRKRTTKKKGSRVERTKRCRTDFGASLSSCSFLFSAPSLTCAGSEEALAVSRNAPSASCSTSDLLPFLCVATNRDRHLFAALFARSYSVPTVGCNIFLCYFLAFVSTYSLVVSICVVFLFAFSVLKGRAPV